MSEFDELVIVLKNEPNQTIGLPKLGNSNIIRKIWKQQEYDRLGDYLKAAENQGIVTLNTKLAGNSWVRLNNNNDDNTNDVSQVAQMILGNLLDNKETSLEDIKSNLKFEGDVNELKENISKFKELMNKNHISDEHLPFNMLVHEFRKRKNNVLSLQTVTTSIGEKYKNDNFETLEDYLEQAENEHFIWRNQDFEGKEMIVLLHSIRFPHAK